MIQKATTASSYLYKTQKKKKNKKIRCRIDIFVYLEIKNTEIISGVNSLDVVFI